jgi:hypothetical protein
MPEDAATRAARRRRRAEEEEDERFVLEHAKDTGLTQEEVDAIDASRQRGDTVVPPDQPVPDHIN